MNQFEPEDMPWVLDFCFTMAMTTFVAFWKTQGSEIDLAGYKQEVMSRFQGKVVPKVKQKESLA